jgi:hypothetical protein
MQPPARTLNLMTYVAIVFVPILAYTMVLLENVRSYHKEDIERTPTHVLSKELNMWYFAGFW